MRGEIPDAFFENNVIHGDYLVDALDAFPPGAVNGFDLVVGNQPYVSAVRLESSYKDMLRDRFLTASGRLDLYTLFIERSIGLLANGGQLAFITPDKFLFSQSARPLRELLLKSGAVRTIARFTSHRVFQDAATVPCITIFQRNGSAAEFEAIECGDQPTASGTIPVLRTSRLSTARLADGPWNVAAPDLDALARRIVADHPLLESCTSRISAGLATGYNRAFLLDRSSDSAVEPDLRWPAVRGRDLAPFKIKVPSLEVLVPYEFNEVGQSSLVDLSRYPGALTHLERHRAALEARHCVRVWGKPWYDLHDPVPFDLVNKPKILVPDVARNNRFAFDDGAVCPLHSVYYLLPDGPDPYFLVAVLNSSPIAFLIKLYAPIMKDGFSRYRKQFLMRLPIPRLSQSAIGWIAQLSRAGDHATVDELICRLFRLEPGEIASLRRLIKPTVESSPLTSARDSLAS